MLIPALTASSLWRAELCPASMVLPSSPRKYRDQKKGHDAHKKLEDEALEGSIPEAAFALNVLSGEGRFIGSKIDRQYGVLAEGEIAGTLDLLTVEAERVCNDDYKTGVGYMQAEPKDNPQLQHGCLAAALVHGKDAAKASLVYTRTGEVKEAEFDAFDLAAILLRLRGIWMRVQEAAALKDSPEKLIEAGLVNIGDACWRCPAEKACPLKETK